MGPECNRFYHRNLPHHHHHKLNQRNAIFLPMLCSRPAIKDVHGLPRCVDRSSSSSPDPLSPRISCIGQVKRKNRVIGFPNPHGHRSLNTLVNNTNNNNKNDNNNVVKYSKLKKFFSIKNLTSNPTTPVAGSSSVDGGGRRRVVAAANGANGNGCCRSCSGGVCNGGKCVVGVVDLDPPLPVVKRPILAQEGMEVESLWKRRSGGVALKGLQLQQIHHPRHHDHDQPTTV